MCFTHTSNTILANTHHTCALMYRRTALIRRIKARKKKRMYNIINTGLCENISSSELCVWLRKKSIPHSCEPTQKNKYKLTTKNCRQFDYVKTNLLVEFFFIRAEIECRFYLCVWSTPTSSCGARQIFDVCVGHPSPERMPSKPNCLILYANNSPNTHIQHIIYCCRAISVAVNITTTCIYVCANQNQKQWPKKKSTN